MENAENYRLVFVTLNNDEAARTLARTLVAESLAACCSITSGVHSIYSWQNQIEEADEVMMLIKTRLDKLPHLERRLQELHSYDVPEIISISVSQMHKPYMQWLESLLSI